MIELNDKEEQLKTLLLDVAKWIDSSASELPQDGQTQPSADLQKEPIVLRFTGGWVRDKLLGTASHDIDVAINKMTGYQFGLKMKEYLDHPDNAASYGPAGPNAAGNLHKIEANPEKSKHLETVTTKILGLDVDLVNLRKETYTTDSRNPEMEFGTPEEDALRRDACVNALFYNLNTCEVEDFTERGLSDMKNKLIRTPLEPYQTFKDDPLRVLRLIRFATRLDYAIDPAAQEAMSHQDIKDALRLKISRERVGIELEKMLRGRDPCGALKWIHQLGLYTTVFTDPVVEPKFEPDLQNWPVIYDYMLELTVRNPSEKDSIANSLLRNTDDHYQAWISTALIPWADAPLPPPPKKNRPPIPLVVSVAHEGFKAPNKVTNMLSSSMQHMDEIRALKDKFNLHMRFPNRRSEGDDATTPDTIGMAVRRWGASWRQQMLFAMFCEIFSNPASLKHIEMSYTNLVNHMASSNLLDACEMKPLLDGKELSKALGTPPGPWMKDALDVVMAWQLRNPGVKDHQAAIEAVQTHLRTKGQQQDETASPGLHSASLDLRNSLIDHFLRNVIRPVFKITPSNPSVTPQGRQATVPQSTRSERISEEATNRPWKRDPYVFPVLRWSVEALSPASIETHWPLLIPPILAIIDDLDSKYKVVGCQLLKLLLQRTPSNLLKRTGLSGVFEEAVYPLLSYLPTLTPVEESVELLNAAFPCLLQLVRTRYPITSRLQDPEAWDAKIKMTTRYIRHGIVHGMMIAGEYPAIATCMVTHLTSLLNEERIDSVRHLKEVVPLLSNILSNPFALAHVPLLNAAIHALQAVIANGWPRADGWKGEILQGVSLLWIRIEVEGLQDDQAVQLRTQLQDTVQMLDAALKKASHESLSGDTSTLIAADEAVASLFDRLSAT